MYNKKWKKLSKRFACALALAMLMSVNPAWADTSFRIDEETNTLYGSGSDLGNNTGIVSGPDFTYNGETHKLSDFNKIVFTADDMLGIKTWSGRFDLSNTDMEITVTGNTTNTDGIHLSNYWPNFIVHNFSAYIDSPTSDAINISHDARGGADAQPYVHVLGDLTAEVNEGNGIRANASLHSGTETSITVDGITDITIHAGEVEVYEETETTIGGITVTAEGMIRYNPAAVYAGDSKYYVNYVLFDVGEQTQGQGIINLEGDTFIKTFGNGNYGVFAGKTGLLTYPTSM